MHLKDLVLLSTLVLAACGGGGGGNSSSASDAGSSLPPQPVAAQYPLDSAISAFMQMQHIYELPLGENSGEQVLQVVNYGPGPEQEFQGQSAFTITNGTRVLVGGTAGNIETRTDYFLTGPFEFLGNTDSYGPVTIAANQVPLPSLASPGQSGTLDSLTIYTDSTLNAVQGTATDTWSLQAITSDTASLCIIRMGSNVYSSTCLTIDTNGDVLEMNIKQGTGLLF